MKTQKTNWSSPKTNIIAGLNDLRKALASGFNARLVKEYNENCDYPILIKNKVGDVDFRKYTFSIGYISTRNEIIAENNEIHSYLTLNYKSCYGTQEAIDNYYNNGILSDDNFKSMGRNHLVKVADLISFLKEKNRIDEAAAVEEKYITGNPDKKDWFDFFRLNSNNAKEYSTKKFKRKLWVVELLSKDEPKAKIPIGVKILNVIMCPLKYIPKRQVLKMDKYTNYTFRIGGVVNGLSVEFQIPKKFNFN